MVGLEKEELNTMIGNGKGATKERDGPPKGPASRRLNLGGRPQRGGRTR
jgi:hypothetical protein